MKDNISDWNLWLSSNETRAVINLLNELIEEQQQLITNGSLLIKDSADQIAVDYAHQVGALEGLKMAITLVKNPKESGEDSERSGSTYL